MRARSSWLGFNMCDAVGGWSHPSHSLFFCWSALRVQNGDKSQWHHYLHSVRQRQISASAWSAFVR
jgi:hypothetical protein